MTLVFFRYSPFLPNTRSTFPNVKGLDNANAHGQATIKIETITGVIFEGSINAQISPAINEIAMTIAIK